MPDENLFRLTEAISSMASLTATYKSEPREFSPHAIGKGRYGEDVVLVYQYGGMSGGRPTGGLPPERCWRMFVIEDMRDIKPVNDEFHTHDSYAAAQERLIGTSTAVKIVSNQS